MFEILFYVGGFCLILGIGYPLCAILVYPFYKLMGGKQNFVDYMRSL